MHEMSIAEGILDAVSRTALEPGETVTEVRVAVGELAGVDVDALLFAWDSVKRGTPADGSRLAVERPPGRAWCMACGKTVEMHRHGDACPLCGGYQLIANQGHELKVLDLTVAKKAPDPGSGDNPAGGS